MAHEDAVACPSCHTAHTSEKSWPLSRWWNYSRLTASKLLLDIRCKNPPRKSDDKEAYSQRQKGMIWKCWINMAHLIKTFIIYCREGINTVEIKYCVVASSYYWVWYLILLLVKYFQVCTSLNIKNFDEHFISFTSSSLDYCQLRP